MAQSFSRYVTTEGSLGALSDIATDFSAIPGFGGLWTRGAGYTPTSGDASDWAASTGSGTWTQATASKQPAIQFRNGRPELYGDGTKVMELTGLVTSGWTEFTALVVGYINAETTTNQRILANNEATPWRLSYRYSTAGFFEVQADASNTVTTQLLPTTAKQRFAAIVGQGATGTYIALRCGGFEWDVFDDTSVTSNANVSVLRIMGQTAAAPSFVGGLDAVALFDGNVFDVASEFRTVRDAGNEL